MANSKLDYYLTGFMLFNILQRLNYSREIVGTHEGALLPEQNPLVSLLSGYLLSFHGSLPLLIFTILTTNSKNLKSIAITVHFHKESGLFKI